MATREATMRDINRLQEYLAKNVPVGKPVELFIGVERDLNSDELDMLQDDLLAGGLELLDPISIGTSGDWENAVRLKFKRPAFPGPGTVGLIPLWLILTGGLAAIGLSGAIGWKLGNIVDSVAKNIVPIALILGGLWVVTRMATKSPTPAR